MLTVLRQEWNARKHNIVFVGVVLFVLAGVCMPIGIAHTVNEISSTSGYTYGFICFASVLVFATVFLYPLFGGAGNVGRQLRSDAGYLLLSLPKRAYIILGGKMLVGLAEFLIYALLAFFCLTLVIPLVTLKTDTYLSSVKNIYHQIFVGCLNETVNVFFASIVFFLVAQAILNLATVVYCSFTKSRKGAFLIFVFICVAIFGMVKIVTFAMDCFSVAAPYNALWLAAGICGLFGLLYFIVTAWLFENKVEV